MNFSYSFNIPLSAKSWILNTGPLSSPITGTEGCLFERTVVLVDDVAAGFVSLITGAGFGSVFTTVEVVFVSVTVVFVVVETGAGSFTTGFTGAGSVAAGL